MTKQRVSVARVCVLRQRRVACTQHSESWSVLERVLALFLPKSHRAGSARAGAGGRMKKLLLGLFGTCSVPSSQSHLTPLGSLDVDPSTRLLICVHLTVSLLTELGSYAGEARSERAHYT